MIWGEEEDLVSEQKREGGRETGRAPSLPTIIMLLTTHLLRLPVPSHMRRHVDDADRLDGDEVVSARFSSGAKPSTEPTRRRSCLSSAEAMVVILDTIDAKIRKICRFLH